MFFPWNRNIPKNIDIYVYIYISLLRILDQYLPLQRKFLLYYESAIHYQVKYGINFDYYIITYIRPSNHFTMLTNTFTSIGKILKEKKEKAKH